MHFAVRANCRFQVSICLADVFANIQLPFSSAVASIASLVLGYDMRRLNDLTAFRRYWYRTSLVESFIGSKKQQQLDHETTEGTIDVDGHSGIEEAVDSSTSAAIVVAAAVEDFRISANVAQVMGNTE